MDNESLIEEIKILQDYISNNTSFLAPEVMELPVSNYTDSQRYQQECQRLFRDYPQFVGPSCLLPNPGDYFAFDDTGIPILIVRNQDGGLNAFLNICSHRGSPLAEGAGHALKDRLLTCPYHGWSYDLDGKLKGIPFGNQGFDSVDRDQRGLRPLKVAEKHGFIFVMPNPELDFDIDEVMGGIGPLLEDFGLTDSHYLGMKKVNTAMSWKLNMDTFHEFYHFEFLHPDSVSTFSHSNICHYRQLGRNHMMSSPSLKIMDLLKQAEESWVGRDNVYFVNYLFPNAVIFVVEDHFQTWRVYPVNEKESVVYHSMYVPKAPASDEEAEAFETYFQMINDVAVTEDYALVEKIQRGVNAGLERSILIGRNEPGVQNMHRQIDEVLG